MSITTDIIVGFPNENEEDFNKTLELYEELKYDLAYTFIYSPRVGTPASVMEDNINLEEKKKRLAILNDVVNKYALESNKKMIDKIYSVLIEGVDYKKNTMMSGYTENNKLVNIPFDQKYMGKIVRVKITKANTWNLYGEIA